MTSVREAGGSDERRAGLPATPGEVFQLVRTGAADTRSGVGRLTGLSRTAVSARLQLLLRSGLVVEGEEGPSTGGRPAATLHFDRHSGIVLAAAVGRSRTQLAVCDLAGDVLGADARAEVEQEPGAEPEEVMPELVDRLAALLERTGRAPGQVRGVGVSIPGTVDRQRGISLDSPILPGWNAVPLAPYFQKLTAAPVVVDNDANVMALSERGGLLESFDDLLLVKASTGIGAGIVSDGRLRRGGLGASGEIGHTRTASAEGLVCRCGDTGCLEAVAGGWALVQALRAEGRDVGHVRRLVALAVEGDAEARRVVRDSGRRLGEVLAAAVNLLNPQAVVIGGDMAGAYDTFVAGLRESLYGAATALATRELQILPATHGEAAGVVGCAALALEEVLSVAAVDALVSRLAG